MTHMWRPSSVRLRLALWYSAAVALVLLIYAVGVYMFVRSSLQQELDRALHDDFETVEQLVETNAPQTNGWPLASGHHTDADEPVRWIEVWGPVGHLQFRSPGMEQLPAPAEVPSGYAYASAITPAGRRARTLTGAHTAHGHSQRWRSGSA